MLRVIQAALLITLVSLPLVTARGAHAADSSIEIAQLNNAFRLLQLQLKQTSETAEHISSLLSTLSEQQSTSLLQNVQEDAAESRPQQQKKQPQPQPQQQQQRAPGPHTGGPQGASRLRCQVKVQPVRPKLVTLLQAKRALLQKSTRAHSAGRWPSG